jgi:hypothetical protein
MLPVAGVFYGWRHLITAMSGGRFLQLISVGVHRSAAQLGGVGFWWMFSMSGSCFSGRGVWVFSAVRRCSRGCFLRLEKPDLRDESQWWMFSTAHLWWCPCSSHRRLRGWAAARPEMKKKKSSINFRQDGTFPNLKIRIKKVPEKFPRSSGTKKKKFQMASQSVTKPGPKIGTKKPKIQKPRVFAMVL